MPQFVDQGKILVVDDSNLNLYLTQDILEDNNFKVVTASSGVECLRILEKENPDLILLDWMMPELSGIEVCKKIKSDPTLCRIKIVMMTAKTLDSDRVEGLKCGADDYLTKPYNSDELLIRVKKQLTIKREKEALKSELDMAEHMVIVGQMASGIAHDFANIMATFEYFKLIQRQTLIIKDQLDPVMQTQLKRSFSVIERMCEKGYDSLRFGKQLIFGLTTFAHGASVKQKREVLGPLVSAPVALLERKIRSNKIDFSFSNEAEREVLICNSGEIQQIVLNLLSNALDALSQQTLKTLSVETKREGQRVIISIEDSGVGIPPDLLDRIFDDFFTTKPCGHGTGIGLSTVKRIIKSHKGEITVTSIPHERTRFTVVLPVASK